jgi:hypothetical protein
VNIVVVHDVGVDVYKSWGEMKKNHSLKKEDFTKVGSDYIVYLTNESYEVSKDVKLLERVAAESVFSRQSLSLSDWCSIGAFVLAFLIYFQIS